MKHRRHQAGDLVEIPAYWVRPLEAVHPQIGIFIRYLTEEEIIMHVGPNLITHYNIMCDVYVGGKIRTYAFNPKPWKTVCINFP